LPGKTPLQKGQLKPVICGLQRKSLLTHSCCRPEEK